MNPELQRNLWLELSPARLTLMVLVQAVVFGVTALVIGNRGVMANPGIHPDQVLRSQLVALDLLGRGLFSLIVILWGSFNAANAIAGEVRGRTWDLQKLSAIEPWAMTWGKLLGSTVYQWFGGLLALAPVALTAWLHPDDAGGPALLVLYPAVGVATQALALLLCLVVARRSRASGQFEVLLYALVGWFIASTIFGVYQMLVARPDWLQQVSWMGLSVDGLTFLVASVVLAAALAVFGCWRLMRRELMMPPEIGGVLLFLSILALYIGGFFVGINHRNLPPSGMPWALLAVGCSTLAVATGVFSGICALAEPKDPVRLRWIATAWRSGDRAAAVVRAPAFAIGYAVTLGLGLLAALLAAVTQAIQGPFLNPTPAWPAILAALGFLARDILIIVCCNASPRQRRGDFSALVILALLYIAGGSLTNLPPLQPLQALFLPLPAAAAWPYPAGPPLGFLGPWLQALAVGAVTIARLRQPAAQPERA